MREPPAGVSAADVLATVREHWDATLDALEFLPVGFGAHHWRGSTAGRPRWFVTLDPATGSGSGSTDSGNRAVGAHHDVVSLEGAYAAAAELAIDLDFVWTPVPGHGGSYTVGLADGRLSCTRWAEAGPAGDGPSTPGQAAATAAMLDRLHAAPPPATIPRWGPRVGPELADRLAAMVTDRWNSGPYAEPVHRALTEALGDVRVWTRRYHELVARAGSRNWVPTHGEPHTANQLLLPDGPRLIDWESLALAPRERDLRDLCALGYPLDPAPDHEMIMMFDLEWRLDEISQYADRFHAEHTGGADDATAFGGLTHELARPPLLPQAAGDR